MPNFRNVITECIQSSFTGDKLDLHLTEAEKTYSEAAEKLDDVQNEIKESEALLNQNRRYFKKLLSDEITAKLEVPRLKKELGSLKEKLISLTFESERWNEVCHKQEGKIANLSEKKSSLNHTLSVTENTLQATEEENSLLEKENVELTTSLDSISSIRAQVDLFNQIVPCKQPSVEAQKLSSPELVNDVNSIVNRIHTAQADKQQADAKVVETSASISTRQENVETTQQHIKKLQDECGSKNEIIATLDTETSALTQQVHELQQRYQAYYEIIEESNTVSEKRNALINTVNEGNANLKESLLACNKLEMTLRLEELKMVVFLKEMEQIDE